MERLIPNFKIRNYFVKKWHLTLDLKNGQNFKGCGLRVRVVKGAFQLK